MLVFLNILHFFAGKENNSLPLTYVTPFPTFVLFDLFCSTFKQNVFPSFGVGLHVVVSHSIVARFVFEDGQRESDPQAIWPMYDTNADGVEGTAYNFPSAVKGNYTLTAMSHQPLAFLNAKMAEFNDSPDVKHGYVLLFNAGGDAIFSHLAAYTQMQGEQVAK